MRMPDVADLADQHQGREIAHLRKVKPAIDLFALQICNRGVACLPLRRRDERIGRLHSLIENEVSIFRLTRGHAPGIIRHGQNLAHIHKTA
jgi:hypothetical protein